MSIDGITRPFDSVHLVDVEEHENPFTAAPDPKPKYPHIFTKMYMNYITETGLFARITPAQWKTLCALSKYIGEDGVCYPTQRTLAKDLGVSQTAVSSRILELAKMLDEDGYPLLEVLRSRKEDGSYEPNLYILNQSVGLHIFKSEPRGVTPWRPEPRPDHGLYGSLGDFLSLDTRRN